MYPSEQYASYKSTVSNEAWKRISEYVDEAYHQGDIPAMYDASSWDQMIAALCALENKTPKSGFNALYEDYKLYWETAGG